MPCTDAETEQRILRIQDEIVKKIAEGASYISIEKPIAGVFDWETASGAVVKLNGKIDIQFADMFVEVDGVVRDAYEMMDEIKAKKLLDQFRGKPAVNREVLARALVNLGRIGLEVEAVAEIDINPMIIHEDTPVAVDALVVLRNPKA